MAEIQYRATADYDQVRRAHQRLEQDMGKLKAKFADMAATSKRVSKEDQELARQAKRIKDQAVTAQDRYNERVKTATTLLRRTKITQREYASEVGKAKQELDGATTAGRRAFGPKLQSMLGTAAGLLGMGGGIAGLVGTVVGQYQKWIEVLDKAGAAADKFHGNVLKTLAGAGDLLAGKELEAFFSSVKGVKRGDVVAAFEGVSGAAPTMGRERRKQIAKAASYLAPAGLDVGATAAAAGELGDTFQKKAADDLVDLAVMLQQTAGRDAGRLTSPEFIRGLKNLQATGAMPAEMTLALGTQALQREVAPEVLTRVANVLTGEFGAKRYGAQFAGAGAAERWKMLQADPSLQKRLLGEQAIGFSRLSVPDAQKMAAQLYTAQTEDVAFQQRVALKRFEAGATTTRLYELEARAEKKQVEEARLGLQKKRYEAAFAEATAGRGFGTYGRASTGQFVYGLADYTMGFATGLPGLTPATAGASAWADPQTTRASSHYTRIATASSLPGLKQWAAEEESFARGGFDQPTRAAGTIGTAGDVGAVVEAIGRQTAAIVQQSEKQTETLQQELSHGGRVPASASNIHSE